MPLDRYKTTLPEGADKPCRYFLPPLYTQSRQNRYLHVAGYFQPINLKLGANGGILRDGACRCNLCKLVQLSAQETDQLPRNGRVASIDLYNISHICIFITPLLTASERYPLRTHRRYVQIYINDASAPKFI